MNGADVKNAITLQFPERGKVSGKAPCNTYSARQTAPLPWFELSKFVLTRKTCPQIDQENLYLETLSRMTLIERKGDILLLSSESESLEYRIAQ